MPDLSPTIDALADRLGFERNGDEFVRFDRRFRLEVDDSVGAWRTMAWSLWSARIAVDQLNSRYDVASERSKPPARNVYEVPSQYGDRERSLIPLHVIRAASRLAEKRLVQADWVDERFGVLFGLAEGFGVHFLGVDELPRVPFDEANIRENARLAHFYGSYKARPVETNKVADRVKVKRFHSVDAKTSSRALLFPDFDWDAAQDGGSVWIPGRDHMVVAEPLEAEFSDHAIHDGRVVARAIEPQIPFYPTRYQLSAEAIEPAEDAWHDRYAAPPDDLPIERLA